MPNTDSALASAAVAPPSRRRILPRLFLEYIRISLCVVGGGYAIIVAADDVGEVLLGLGVFAEGVELESDGFHG